MSKTLLPGDFVIDRLEITSYEGKTVDIGEMTISLDLFEDVFYPFVTAELVLLDSSAFLENLPLVGGEKIRMRFSTGEGYAYYDKLMDVYSVTDVENEGGNLTYKIYCVSEMSTKIHNTRISMSYDDFNHRIVERVMRQTLRYDGRLYLEPTKYQKKLVVPNWNPLKLFNYLSTTSVRETSNDDTDVGYTFFENRDGFNFVTLCLLRQGDPVISFRDKRIHNENPKYFNEVLDWSVPVHFDRSADQLGGTFGNTTFVHSIINKSVSVKEMRSESNKAFGEYSPCNVVGLFSGDYYNQESRTFGNNHRAKLNRFKSDFFKRRKKSNWGRAS